MSVLYQLLLTTISTLTDPTLKVGSFDYLEHIPTVVVTFVQATFVHIKNISAVKWPDFFKTVKVGSWVKARSRQGLGKSGLRAEIKRK